MLRRVTKRDPVFSNKESICDQGEGSFRGEGGVESKLQCGGSFWAEDGEKSASQKLGCKGKGRGAGTGDRYDAIRS